MNRKRWKPISAKHLRTTRDGGDVTFILWKHRKNGKLETSTLDGHWDLKLLGIEPEGE